MKDMAEQIRRLKKMHAEMSMQNDLLKEALGKRGGHLRGESWP
jgi:putative transposase